MKRQGEKNELLFALAWIGIYCLTQSLANPLSEWLGGGRLVHAFFSTALSAVLLYWIVKNGLLNRYGLCASPLPARKFLWYIPLVILPTVNLWNGVAMNGSVGEMTCHIVQMLGVGFIEEVLFRGLLFEAIRKDSVRQAVVISSVTFGLGHLINLINGSGAGFIPTLCQVCGAVAIGFLFVTIFYRGGSLLPCIFTHAAINSLSAFANEAGLTEQELQRVIFLTWLWVIIIVAVYTLFLMRTLPKKPPEQDGAAA